MQPTLAAINTLWFPDGSLAKSVKEALKTDSKKDMRVYEWSGDALPPGRVVFGLIVPIRRTRSSRAARALFGRTKSLGADCLVPSPEQVLSVPDLTKTRRSGPRTSCGRGLCVAFVARRLARPSGPSRLFPGRSQPRQESDQLPTERVNGAGGLNTVVEEDLEDWVDDFEAISISEVPLGVEGVGQAGSSGASQSPSTSESDTTTSSPHTKQSQAQPRPRTTSKTSRRSRKSSRRDTELRLILDFPLPPTFIPSPTKSRTPSSALPPPEVTPIHDDGSVFYDRDPFRVESTHDQEAVEEGASLNIPDASAPRVDSSVSFYTAHSRSSSPAAPSGHLDRSSSSHSSLQQEQQPPLSPLHLPFPGPSSLSPPLSLTGSPSTTRLSIRTLTRASATLKRFGNLTRETFRTSFRTPISELTVRRYCPIFSQKAFDITFPAVDTPRSSPRVSRVQRNYPSVQSFYASLEEFLTSHLHSDESNRRSRFRSAPTLLLTSERDPPKRADLPSAEVQVVPPTPPSTLPRQERPLPPLPREGYEFVDPSTLTESLVVSPDCDPRYSSTPPSPSWLSRNVRDLEIALAKRVSGASSAASSRSAYGSDSEEDVSTIHLPKAVQTQTPSPSTTASSTRLRGEVVLLRGRVNIQDTTPRRITLRSLPPSSKTTSEATVVVRTRARSRRNRSGHSGQQRLVISTVPPNPPVRPRSRTSSVTKATITHYRRSLLDTKKKHRPPRKEDSARSSSVDRVPKARPIPFY
ncbi:hypothetical protein F5148DRAFT_1282859 [Russula earlei]|uniref:Uncharacterized protein n=1 Tax=Russula earlei TaxID=71964 RepID=A0ACC0UEN0_9AGAM|nr:hypothetical protein F5148DRAFT_1282859 [Russula earlei]